MNIFLVVSATFLFTLLVGRLLDKIKLPWIFSALILGGIFTMLPPIMDVIHTSEFGFLSNIGMLMLLFLIGLEIDMTHVIKHGKYIFGSAIVIIFLEAIVGTFLVHYLFGEIWTISILVSLSFATVGEAVLAPILETFGITKTALGTSLLSIGTVDDLVEVVALIATVSLIDFQSQNQILYSGTALIVLFLLTLSFIRIKKRSNNYNFHPVETMFLFAFFVFFLFIGVGAYADASSLGALLAGISIKHFMPDKRLEQIEHQVKAVGYGLFAPLFFVQVGSDLHLGLLWKNIFLVMVIVLATTTIKILSSMATSYQRLGLRGSVLLGIGLSVKFSLSLVIISLLHEHNLITDTLYSVMIGSSVVFVLVMPLIFSRLIMRWKEQIPLTYRLRLSAQRS